MIQHVARGMVGAIIVDPKNPKAMPKADREYVLVQTELYKDVDDVQAMFDKRYDNVVFNGGVFKYDPVHSKAGGHFLEAKPGERVRFFFVNAGPNNFSAVHPIAEIWEGVYPIVTHSLTDALRGAIAILNVSKDAQRLPLMPFVELGRPVTEAAPTK